MSRGPDAATLLVRSLARSAAAHRIEAAINEPDSIPWASVTFTGARHVFGIELQPAAAAAAWLAALPEADLPMRGHLVAEIVVTNVETRGCTLFATIAALTVEDR